MTTWFAQGSSVTELTDAELRSALFSVYDELGARRKVIALPPTSPDSTAARDR